jgi:hypothetical protein
MKFAKIELWSPPESLEFYLSGEPVDVCIAEGHVKARLLLLNADFAIGPDEAECLPQPSSL